ncbi:hypothetical protein [Micromonospora sediminicola]|uniref:hypothetical protein n=1 Tax=Micromonospora sediminicola TaxID=946078 RepID=UPI0037960F95
MVRLRRRTALGLLVGGAAAGTVGWTMALDRRGHRDPRIERATANVLDRIVGRSRTT